MTRALTRTHIYTQTHTYISVPTRICARGEKQRARGVTRFSLTLTTMYVMVEWDMHISAPRLSYLECTNNRRVVTSHIHTHIVHQRRPCWYVNTHTCELREIVCSTECLKRTLTICTYVYVHYDMDSCLILRSLKILNIVCHLCVNFIVAISNADRRERSRTQSARTILCARHVKLFLDSTLEMYLYMQGLQIIAFPFSYISLYEFKIYSFF